MLTQNHPPKLQAGDMTKIPKRLLLPMFALLTACGSGPFGNPFTQHIDVTMTPNSLTLTPGSSARVNVSGTASGTTTPITGLAITAHDVPQGLSVVTGTGSVTVTAASTAEVGSYSIPLDVSTTGGKGSAVLPVTISLPTEQAYTLSFTPSPVTLEAGKSIRVAGTAVDSAGKIKTDVRIRSISGVLKTSYAVTDSLGFTISSAPSDTPGSYVLLVTTTDGVNTVTTPVSVTLSVPTGT